MEYWYVGIGGIFGALLRYRMSVWVGRRWPHRFPIATFGINSSGSFILGFLYILFFKAGPEFTHLNSLITTGFLGAYTTYSTFSYEIINLVQDGERWIAARYLAASVIIGLGAAFAGIWVASSL